MAKQPSPDKRLVYLHCSSIFSGPNAKVRRPKKVSQLLEQHRGSIKILTKESTLPAIAAAAKELLDEEIFNPRTGQSSYTRSCFSRQRRKRPRERPLRLKSFGSRPKLHMM